MKKIELLNKWINECNNIVVMTGAGVSTESGIKDFRSKDGLYNMDYVYPPEEILSRSFFLENPDEFYRFYKDKLNTLDIEPNLTHRFLKELEDKEKLKCIVTQNIDGLHEKAGSRNIINLHGSVYKNHCIRCKKSYDADYVFNKSNKCICGGFIKPDVVLYEEALDLNLINKAIYYISKCDMLIVMGTSLMVYPANSLINYFKGKYLVVINNKELSIGKKADLVITDELKNVISKLIIDDEKVKKLNKN